MANSFTLVLPSDSSQYTVFIGSTFDSVTVNTSSFDFVMSAGSSIEITSADKKNFTVSPSLGATTLCESSQSRIVLSKGQGATTETITVSPSGSCSSSSGGGGAPGSVSTGGGGGGGGGSSYSPPAPTPTPTPRLVVPTPTPISAPASPTIASIQQQIAAIMARITALRSGQETPAPTAVPPAYGVFARVMNPGERSDEVHRLQQLLAQDPAIYPEGTASGYYGTLTRNAVRRFQLKYGVIASANDLGNGRVGPKTMAKLNEIFGGSSAPVVSPPTAPPVPQSAPTGTTGNQAQINAIMQKIQEIQAKINALQGQ